MITPAYSLTATERVLPRMALDFTTGVLDPRVTVTRALDTATAINSSGFIAIVNANLPRFDYDPATLAPKGLLIEEARTNFVLQSNTLTSNADATVTANAATSPDGTTNAYRITKANATDPVYSSKTTSMTVAANTTYTVSRFVKYDGYNTTVSLEYNNTNNWGGTAWYAFFSVTSTGVTVSLVNSCTATVTNFGNGWYRLTATFTTGGAITTPSNPSILLRITGGSGVTVLGYGVQLEAGAFATSYIPTTTTSLTRNADVVSMTGTNFSSWYSNTRGAFWAAFDVLQSTAPAYIYSAYSGATGFSDSFIQYVFANTVDSFVYSGGVSQARLLAGVISANTPAKSARSYANANFAIATNGGSLATQLSGSLPVGVDRLQIGASPNTGDFLNGHIAKLFWYANMTNAELVAFTK